MSIGRIIGIILIAGGAILLFLGYQASQSLVEQGMSFFTGRFTDETMIYLIGGGLAALSGVLLILFARNK
ncbi:MAG: DUF3185 family protein [Spirochaetales bacterium]|nr:DUF3185 family protein [Spirochaetales bacterium]